MFNSKNGSAVFFRWMGLVIVIVLAMLGGVKAYGILQGTVKAHVDNNGVHTPSVENVEKFADKEDLNDLEDTVKTNNEKATADIKSNSDKINADNTAIQLIQQDMVTVKDDIEDLKDGQEEVLEWIRKQP